MSCGAPEASAKLLCLSEHDTGMEEPLSWIYGGYKNSAFNLWSIFQEAVQPGHLSGTAIQSDQQYHRHKGNSSVHPVKWRQHAAVHLAPASGYPCPVGRWLDRKCRDPEDPIRFPGRTYGLLLLRSHAASVYKSEKPERKRLYLQGSENGLHDRDVWKQS